MSVKVEVKSDAEWADIIDGAARYYLDMSGAEFMRAYEHGDFDEDQGAEGLMAVLALLPPR